MANAIRAEKGYSVHVVKREDGQAPKAESLGSVIAWEVGGGAPKPVTVSGSPDGEYLVTDFDGRIRDQKGRSFRRMEEALSAGGEEGPKPKTRQEADQALVSGPPNQIEGQSMQPTPTVAADEVRVDGFNTVNQEDTQLTRSAEKKEAAVDADPEQMGEEAQAEKPSAAVKPGEDRQSARSAGRPRK